MSASRGPRRRPASAHVERSKGVSTVNNVPVFDGFPARPLPLSHRPMVDQLQMSEGAKRKLPARPQSAKSALAVKHKELNQDRMDTRGLKPLPLDDYHLRHNLKYSPVMHRRYSDLQGAEGAQEDFLSPEEDVLLNMASMDPEVMSLLSESAPVTPASVTSHQVEVVVPEVEEEGMGILEVSDDETVEMTPPPKPERRRQSYTKSTPSPNRNSQPSSQRRNSKVLRSPPTPLLMRNVPLELRSPNSSQDNLSKKKFRRSDANRLHGRGRVSESRLLDGILTKVVNDMGGMLDDGDDDGPPKINTIDIRDSTVSGVDSAHALPRVVTKRVDDTTKGLAVKIKKKSPNPNSTFSRTRRESISEAYYAKDARAVSSDVKAEVALKDAVEEVMEEYTSAGPTTASPEAPEAQENALESRIPEKYHVVNTTPIYPTGDAHKVSYRNGSWEQVVHPAVVPSSRQDVEYLHSVLLQMLEDFAKEKEYGENRTAVDTHFKEQNVYDICLDEIARQVACHCGPRGELMSTLLSESRRLFREMPKAYEKTILALREQVEQMSNVVEVKKSEYEALKFELKKESEEKRDLSESVERQMTDIVQELSKWKSKQKDSSEDVKAKYLQHLTFRREQESWRHLRQELDAKVSSLMKQLEFERSLLGEQQLSNVALRRELDLKEELLQAHALEETEGQEVVVPSISATVKTKDEESELDEKEVTLWTRPPMSKDSRWASIAKLVGGPPDYSMVKAMTATEVIVLANDIYRKKLAADGMDDFSSHPRQTMPDFLFEVLLVKYTKKSEVHKTTWRLIEGIRSHENQNQDIRLFGLFLDEGMTQNDLNLFLYLREVCRNTPVGINYPPLSDGRQLLCTLRADIVIRNAFRRFGLDHTRIRQLMRKVHDLAFRPPGTEIAILSKVVARNTSLVVWEADFMNLCIDMYRVIVDEKQGALKKSFHGQSNRKTGQIDYPGFVKALHSLDGTLTEREISRLFVRATSLSAGDSPTFDNFLEVAKEFYLFSEDFTRHSTMFTDSWSLDASEIEDVYNVVSESYAGVQPVLEELMGSLVEKNEVERVALARLKQFHETFKSELTLKWNCREVIKCYRQLLLEMLRVKQELNDSDSTNAGAISESFQSICDLISSIELQRKRV